MVTIRNLLGKAKKATAFMYDKMFAIERNVITVKPNGAEYEELQTVLENEPCRLSYPGGSFVSTNTKLQEVSEILYDAKLFADPSVEIRPGDVITVADPDSLSLESFVLADEPRLYVSHQEVTLKRKGLA